ncbi:MAG: hypothetical protein CL561_02210 [Alphaproteobacteria bacterium]|nr:hypothetical protein [Alphaproteobacteria bacterium]|tara:strand:- start:108661 stop:109770 length:1110 start_codon:yes stop_codon:yes gene_type:complete
MNNSDDEIENINTKSSFDFDECYDLTTQDCSVQDGVSLYTHENDIDVIDCTVIPHIDLRDILDDVSALELDDIEDMQQGISSYNDVAHWAFALLNQSATGARLLKNAAHFDWAVAFETLDELGWTLDNEDYIASINKAQIKAESLGRSPFFLNTILSDIIRAQRDIWLEEKCEIDYTDHHPETVLKVERMRAADIESVLIQVAWELRSIGYASLWRHLLGADIGDMAILFSRFMERDPASLFDGSALLVAFKQWYADEDRMNVIDRVALEICDDILLSATENKRVFKQKTLSDKTLQEFFALPEGRVYLAPIMQEILRSPYFAAMHDAINEAHLYHILRDLEVCYVGNVPFRDPVLADKIFPDYTKILK